MTQFFEPPPDPWIEQAPATNSPHWTGRRQGRQSNEAVSDVLIGQSATATVSVGYIDAYPDGFELQISGGTSVGFEQLRREGESSGADIFGRHWPMVNESSSVLPAELLRVGVLFSDGRKATSVSGHDRPIHGPVMMPLAGGVSGRSSPDGVLSSQFHQGYWVSPLPPEGVLRVFCEWPSRGIAIVQADIDSSLIRDAAERARELFPVGDRVRRDGREWQVGSSKDVDFVSEAVTNQTAVDGLIPADLRRLRDAQAAQAPRGP